MKNPFKFILPAAGALLLAASVLRAEDPATPPSDQSPPAHRGPGVMMERIAKKLGLTADQEAKWKDIGQQERSALEAIRSDSTLAKEDRHAKAMETRKTYAEQRRAILTPDQQKIFDEMQAKMRERAANRAKAE